MPVIKPEYSNYIDLFVFDPNKSMNQVLLLKGNSDQLISNLRSVLNKVKGEQGFFKSTNSSSKSINEKNVDVRVRGVSNPNIVISTDYVPPSKAGGIQVDEDDFDMDFEFNKTAFPWRNPNAVTLSDDLESVEAAITNLLGTKGLDNTEFKTELSPDVLGRLSQLRIELLREGDTASVKVARHEAMHYVINHLLAPETAVEMLNQARVEMVNRGLYQSINDINAVIANEWVADMFMEGNYNTLPKESWIKQIINWIRNLLPFLEANESTLRSIMRDTDKGVYRNAEIRNRKEITLESKIDNIHTGLSSVKNISKFFKTVDNARMVLNRVVLIPTIERHSFLNKYIDGGSLSIYGALEAYMKKGSEAYEKNAEKFKKGLKYPVTVDGKLQMRLLPFEDIFSATDNSQIIDDALNANRQNGEYSKQADKFLKNYLYILLFSPNRFNAVNSKLANDLFQLVFPGIDIQVKYTKSKDGDTSEAQSMAANYIFRDPNKDSGQFDPNETRSTVYDMFLSIIPAVSISDKTQSQEGFINPNVIFHRLTDAANNLRNKGIKNITLDDIYEELKLIQSKGTPTEKNVIHSFLRVMQGDGSGFDIIGDEIFEAKNKRISFKTITKVGDKEEERNHHLGFEIFQDEKFKARVAALEDEELKKNIISKGKEIEYFISGLKMHILSIANNELGKIEQKGGIIQTKRITKTTKVLDSSIINAEMKNRLLLKDSSRLKQNVIDYLNSVNLGIGTERLLFYSGSTSLSLGVDAIKKILGVDVTETFVKSLIKDPDIFKQFHNFLKDVKKMSVKDAKTLPLFTTHADILDHINASSHLGESIRMGEMVRNVEGALTYTKTLGSSFSSNFLGTTTYNTESLSERIASSTIEEIGDSKLTPLSEVTNLLLSNKFQLVDVFTLNGVTTETKGTRIDNLNDYDKYYLMKQLLFEGVNKGVNDFFAYGDPFSDKVKMAMFAFKLNREEVDNIFTIADYNLTINNTKLFDVLKVLNAYDNEVTATNKRRFDAEPNDEARRKNLILGTQYYEDEKGLHPAKSKGIDGGKISKMDDIRKNHRESMLKFASEIKNSLSEKTLLKFFKYQDISSFKEFENLNDATKEAFKQIEIEDVQIKKTLDDNKKDNVPYDKDKTYLKGKKKIIAELSKIMFDNNFVIEKKGIVHMMPIIELMYWSHEIANKTMSTLMRGSELQTKDVVDYVKRAAGFVAPGTLLINNEFKSMSDKLKVLHLDDIKDSYKLFGNTKIDATDGVSALNPVFHLMMQRMSGGLATNVSSGSLKNVYYNYDKANDRVDYHKMNSFAMGETEYKNSKFHQSFMQVSLGGKDSILYKKFIDTFNENKDFKAAIIAVADFLETDEGSVHKDDLIHYMVFNSAVKQGKSNINTFKGNTVATAEFTDGMIGNTISLDPEGYRMQQITTQNSFNSRTSVPTQILNVVSVLQHNKGVADDIEKAMAFFSNDIRRDINKILYSKLEGSGKINERKAYLRDILMEYALKNQSSDKAISLITEKDVDYDVIREKVIQVLSSRIKNSMNGSMPGAYHIQGVWFSDIYINDLGETKLFEDLTAEDEGVFEPRELNPQGYVREDGSFINDPEELKATIDTKDVDDRYKKLFDEQNLIINSTIVLPEAKVEKAKAKLIKLELSKAEEIALLEAAEPSFTYRKAEVIAPFTYASRFGIKKGETLHKSFMFGTKSLYSATGDVTYDEILKVLNKEIKGELKIEELDKYMPSSMRKKFQSLVSKSFEREVETTDDREATKQARKKTLALSKSSILKRLANYYLNLNRSMDMFSVRIPTTGASMGSTGRLVAFSWGVENTAYLSPKKNILDGSDYDADQLNIFFRALDEYSRVVDSKMFDTKKTVKKTDTDGNEVDGTINPQSQNEAKISKENPLEYNQNLIFNALDSYYSNVKNREFILQRIDLDTMRDVRNEIEREEEYYYNMGSSLRAHKNNSSGRKLVGHFANLTTFLNSISRASRKTEVMDYLNDITEIFKDEDTFLEVTRITTILVNAATDNANEGGMLGSLGITEATSPLVSGFLFKYNNRIKNNAFTSVDKKQFEEKGLEKALYEFMQTPLVKEVVRRVDNKNTYTNNFKATPINEAMLLTVDKVMVEKKGKTEAQILAATNDAKIKEQENLQQIKEIQEYAKVGEQLKRMGMAIQAYRDPGSSLEGIHTNMFDIQLALGHKLDNYFNKIKQETSIENFKPSEQTKYIKENLKTKQSLKYETEIRTSLNIPFILSRLGNITSQLKAIDSYSKLTHQLFSITNFYLEDENGKKIFGIDAYEKFITKQKGNRDDETIKKFYYEMERAFIGLYVNTLGEVKMPIFKYGDDFVTDDEGNILTDTRGNNLKLKTHTENTYDLTKIKEEGRLKFVKDFSFYIDHLHRTGKYSNNAFINAVRTRTISNHRQVGIEELSSQTDLMIAELRTGFYHLEESDKKLFRIYQSLNEGFYNYRGSMNLVMDSELEKDYSLFLRKLKLTNDQKIKMLTDVGQNSLLGLKTNKDVIDENNNVKADFNAELGYVDRVSVYDEEGKKSEEKIGFPAIYRKHNGEYTVSTTEYGVPFNTYGATEEAAYPGKFFNYLSFADIEQMEKDGKYVIINPTEFIPVSSKSSPKTIAMPANGDIVILRDGSKATVTVVQDKETKVITITPLDTNVREGITKTSLRTTAKKLEFFIDKIQAAFPNIKIEIINSDTEPIAFIHNGVIYLNDSKIQYSSPIHEVGHIFLKMLQQSNNKAYTSLIKEAQSLLDAKDKTALLIEAEYEGKAGVGVLEEIIITVMGFNTADKVKRFLADNNSDQSFAEKIFNDFRS
jgi:hypothetical protein